MEEMSERDEKRLLGVISDTHGLLRPEAVEALRGVDLIVHAGDVGEERVLEALQGVAPVRAVRGNVDHGALAARLPATDLVEWAGLQLYVLHDVGRLDLDPATAGVAAVISGHSHRPELEERGGVLFLNPGSAGPRRFALPVSVGRLVLEGGQLRGELIRLRDH